MALVSWNRCRRGKHEYHGVSKYCITANACRYCEQPKDPIMDPIRLQAIKQADGELADQQYLLDADEPFGHACMVASRILGELLLAQQLHNPKRYAHR